MMLKLREAGASMGCLKDRGPGPPSLTDILQSIPGAAREGTYPRDSGCRPEMSVARPHKCVER
jgi:hypothetical protein